MTNEPISVELAHRRIRTLRRRLVWIDKRLANATEQNAVSFNLAERAALTWAIDELEARYNNHPHQDKK